MANTKANRVREPFERRTLLKHIGGITAASATFPTVSADDVKDDVNIDIGRQRVVELQISSEIVEAEKGRVNTPQGCSFHPPRYYVNDQGAFVVHRSENDLLKYETHLNTYYGVRDGGGERTEIGFDLAIHTDLNGHDGYFVETEEKGKDFIFGVTVGSKKTLIEKGSEEVLTTSKGEKREAPLKKMTVPAYDREAYELQDGGEILERYKRVHVDDHTLQPELLVHDRGEVPIYSTSNRYIFPDSMPGSTFLVKQAETSEELEIREHDNNIFTIAEVGA